MNKQAKDTPAQEEAPEIMDVLDNEGVDANTETAEEAENADLQNQLEAARAEIEKEKKKSVLLYNC